MTQTRSFADLRDDVVDHLRRAFLGPSEGREEVLRDRPDRLYLVGTLYPRGQAARRLDGDVVGEDEFDEALDQPIDLANAWHPASAAISFLHDGTTITCDVTAARYERLPEGGWQRHCLGELPITLDSQSEPTAVLDGRGRLVSEWRRLGDAWLVTVAVENAAVHEDAQSAPPTEDCLFQVSLRCAVDNGGVRPYPSVDLLNNDPEEQELRLLYRNRQAYGVGHGCSVGWAEPAADGRIAWVATEMLPAAVVPGVSPGDRGQPVLGLAFLSDEGVGREDLRAALHSFVADYTLWISARTDEAKTLDSRHHAAAERLLERMSRARERMTDGIERICGDGADDRVLTAFRLANWAMREQILQTRLIRAAPGRRGQPLQERPESPAEPSWYPFQLAFQLLTIASTADPQHDDRDTVDLIWFPTGGGKTEAYLALAAFEMIQRRLVRGLRGGGTAVLTRYTLRMLTAQQFQRAATLICALESLRHADRRLQGVPPFSIGLWVGGETTPNGFKTAHEVTQKLLKAQEPESPFQINDCPWCGTPLIPSRRTTDKNAYGVRSTTTSFEVFCPHAECDFSGSLPVRVVDEQIFGDPPTLLVATVDKLARVPWVKDSGTVLGRGNTPYDPPGLIIQDELHLLSGPLGTTVALYEAAVLGLIGWDGGRPKIVASTATIRSAPEQVQRLYGASVALFPPSGLDADDSYFARIDSDAPGRLYFGLMPQAHTQSHATVLTCVALLEAPTVVGDSPQDLDAYWTVVAYHNSLRELGRTVTNARDSVESLLTARADPQTGVARRLRPDGVVELTSNVRPGLLMKQLARLERTVEHDDPIDLVATTNMLSVGIDIARLGLMLMNGQPKTASEYIQATSRVGRSGVPGLVVTLLRAGKPRDRSHYESFVAFHQSIYRHVEPTSVTPWSMASRNRSLHAALVMLIRHGCGLRTNEAAGDFRAEDRSVDKAKRILLDAVRRAEPEACADASAEVDSLVAEWDRRAREAEKAGLSLHYNSKDNPALLRDFGERKDGWDTMHSMRSVDRQVRVIAFGESL